MLNNKNKKQLKTLGMTAIKYNIGKFEVKDELIDMLNKALIAHELIKLVFNKSIIDNQEEILTKLQDKLNFEIVFKIGHTILIYKENKNKKDKIVLNN